MTIPELYEALERHDWFHEMSDDYSICVAGRDAFHIITTGAANLGQRAVQMVHDFIMHKHSNMPKPKLEDYV